MKHILERMGRDLRGATAIEYGLVVAGIGVTITAALFLVGDDVAALLDSLGSSLPGNDDGTGGTPVISLSFTDAADMAGWRGGAAATISGFGEVLQIDRSARHPITPAAETVTTRFDLPAGSTSAVLEFDMTFADSWDDEETRIYVNGTAVASGRFDWDEGLGPPPALGLQGAEGITVTASEATTTQNTGVSRFVREGTDYTYRMRIEVSDPGEQVSLGFGTTLDSSGTWDESLLVDNVTVSARN